MFVCVSEPVKTFPDFVSLPPRGQTNGQVSSEESLAAKQVHGKSRPASGSCTRTLGAALPHAPLASWLHRPRGESPAWSQANPSSKPGSGSGTWPGTSAVGLIPPSLSVLVGRMGMGVNPSRWLASEAEARPGRPEHSTCARSPLRDASSRVPMQGQCEAANRGQRPSPPLQLTTHQPVRVMAT